MPLIISPTQRLHQNPVSQVCGCHSFGLEKEIRYIRRRSRVSHFSQVRVG